MDASIIIPSLDGGCRFIECANAIAQQQYPGEFEVVIIDSGSQDGSIGQVTSIFRDSSIPCKLLQIPKSTFKHGPTRNDAAEQSSGQYLAFLTQDAVPHDPRWLAHLLDPYQSGGDPGIVGTFGRHLAHQGHPSLLARNMDNHFNHMQTQPLRFIENRGTYNQNEQVRQFLHFFSNNNSSMLRSEWELHPFPDVDFGEDQTWAKEAIEAGKRIYYCHDAAVHHSHLYSIVANCKRAVVEMRYYYKYFGYDISQKPSRYIHYIVSAIHNDIRWMIREKAFNWANLSATFHSHVGGGFGRSFFKITRSK